jgi:SecD/SecF fusion protein
MRYQPDFGGHLNDTEIAPLGEPNKAQEYTSFAVLVRPADTNVPNDPVAWGSFAGGELNLLTAALHRSQAMLATNFDAAIAGQTVGQAIFAIVLSWLMIVLYLWLRFGSIRWGLAAVICLIHDTLIVVGLLAASGWLYSTAFGRALMIDSFKIDLGIVAAVLTVIGYSVNDTIVVFDRIRENRGKLTSINAEIINASINQTLPRTLLTSFTVLLVVAIMYVAGGAGIHGFNFVLLVGVAFGTYSSIAIASPLLLGFRAALTGPAERAAD